jgi:hypothetical protein
LAHLFEILVLLVVLCASVALWPSLVALVEGELAAEAQRNQQPQSAPNPGKLSLSPHGRGNDRRQSHSS